MLARDHSSVDKGAFLEAMSSLAGAVHVVATVEDGVPIGVVATSVCSLSADPPSLVVCLNKTTSAHDPILRQGFFAVYLLDARQSDVARRFMTEKGVARFSHDAWHASPGEVPHLRGAVACFDCELDRVSDGYSHSILIGRIVALERGDEAEQRSCLLWHQRRFARPAAAENASTVA